MVFESFLAFLSKVFCFSAYIRNSGSFPEPLDEEEERKYLEASKQGDAEARDILIRHNLRLVAHIVKKYSGAGLLRPGNRVDVILAAQTDPQKSRAFASQKNFDVARTLLHNLRVIAVDHTIEPKGFGADPQSSDPRMVRSSTPANINRKGTVTLEVTPKDVELLTVARSNGQLSLSLRNSQSGEAVQTGLPEKELTKLAEIIPSRSVKTPQAAVKVKTFYGSSTEPPQQ